MRVLQGDVLLKTVEHEPGIAEDVVEDLWSFTDPIPTVRCDLVVDAQRRAAVFDLLYEMPQEHGADALVTARRAGGGCRRQSSGQS